MSYENDAPAFRQVIADQLVTCPCCGEDVDEESMALDAGVCVCPSCVKSRHEEREFYASMPGNHGLTY